MNAPFEQEFEHLPFAAEAEQEFERGVSRRPTMPAMGRAGSRPRARPRPYAGPRPSPRPGPWPRPRPRPYYGGVWPYGAMPAFPEPAYEPAYEPLQEPFPDSGDFGDAPPDEGETPPTLSAALARLPGAQRPAYQALGSIAAAIASARSAVPGLYLIEFTSEGKRRAYSGQSDNVRKRLQQHQLCAQMLGLSLAGHQVYVAPLPKLAKDGRRALEKAIHTDMFAHHGGVLTNQRRELELGLLGSGSAGVRHRENCLCPACSIGSSAAAGFEVLEMVTRDGKSPLP